MMWEGQVEYGDLIGFGRLITFDYAFIGYFNSKRITNDGYGLYFENNDLKYSGFYQNLRLIKDEPLYPGSFDKFT